MRNELLNIEEGFRKIFIKHYIHYSSQENNIGHKNPNINFRLEFCFLSILMLA